MRSAVAPAIGDSTRGAATLSPGISSVPREVWKRRSFVTNTTPIMISIRLPRVLVAARSVASAFCAVFSAVGQQAPTAMSAAPDAATLARYDTNKNGRLDPEEVTAMRADEAKAARKDDVIELTPFEVSAANDKGYSAANTMAGTRLNSKLEDIAGSIS